MVPLLASCPSTKNARGERSHDALRASAFEPEVAAEYLPVERAEVRRLDALFAKGKKPAARQVAGPQAAPVVNAHRVKIDDDDVPF